MIDFSFELVLVKIAYFLRVIQCLNHLICDILMLSDIDRDVVWVQPCRQ